MKIEFKECTSEYDLQRIAQLAQRIWTIYYPSIIGDEQVNYMLNRFYTPDALQKQVNEGQHFIRLERAASELGFMAWSVKEDGSFFLNKIYIDPALHGQGLGSQCMRHLFSISGAGHDWRLTVNRKNIKAINFYFKTGFILESCADFDIGEGYLMEDFIMIKKG